MSIRPSVTPRKQIRRSLELPRASLLSQDIPLLNLIGSEVPREVLTKLIEGISDHVFIKDTKGRYILVNSAFSFEMLGKSPKNVEGKRDKDIFSKERYQLFHKEDIHVINTGKVFMDETHIVINKKLNIFQIKKTPYKNEQGKVIGIVGVARDVTEQKLHEESLTQLNKKIINILESITDAFFAIDNEWKFTYINNQAEVIFKRKRSRVLNKKIWDIFPETRDLEFYKKCSQAVKTGNPTEFEEYFPALKKWFEIHIYPAKEGLSVYFNDITEKVELANRKDEFIAIASHELKSPLASIKAFNQILGKRLKGTDVQNDYYIERVESQIGRINSIISDLLDVTKISSGKLELNRERCDLKLFTQQVIADLKTTTMKTINFKCKATETTAEIDKSRMNQVLINLIMNAIKYAPNSNKVDIHLANKDDSIVISVTDYGVGIPEKDLKKIFERFYRVKRTGKNPTGLGLGLYITSEIIRKHGGRITVKSKINKGSTFSIVLPISKA